MVDRFNKQRPELFMTSVKLKVSGEFFYLRNTVKLCLMTLVT